MRFSTFLLTRVKITESDFVKLCEGVSISFQFQGPKDELRTFVTL